MTKMLKRCLSLLAAGTLLVGGIGAMAEEAQIMPISADTENRQIAEKVNDKTIYVEGIKLDKETKRNENGQIMIPLRDVCEELGFKVEWNAASNLIVLNKGPVFITVNPSKDGYTFSKTAPLELGEAPIVIDNTTYVPINFVDAILDGKAIVNYDAAYVYVSIQNFEDKLMMNGIIKDISNDQVTIGLDGIDDFGSAIVLNLGEKTVIEDKEGKAITSNDLKIGDSIYAEFSKVMTRSIPPQSAVYKIVVTEETKNISYYGEVAKIDGKSLSIGGVDMDAEIIVHVSDKTIVKDAKGDVMAFEDIKEGTVLRITTLPIVTASLPPQSTAVIIQAIANAETEATFIETNNKSIIVTTKDGDTKNINNQIIFHTSAETKIYKGGKLISLADLTAGDKLVVKHSTASTMSIPPQMSAFIINAK